MRNHQSFCLQFPSRALLLAALLCFYLTPQQSIGETAQTNDKQAQSASSNTLITGELQTLATDLQFTEGPVWVSSGSYLLFSDIEATTIYKWQSGKPLSAYKKPSNKANGLTLDQQGRLIACETETRRVVLYKQDGTTQSLADKYEGKQLNAPNDIVVHSSGRIYFSDPASWGQPSHVYRIDPNGSLHQATPADGTPNGLAFSPDEKLLYVSDWWKSRIMKYDVSANGDLSNGRLFCLVSNNPDGLKVDTEGRVYTSSSDGIQIFTSNGAFLERISVPGNTTSNCAFGGSDFKTLFIAANSDSLKGRVYSIRVKDPGLAPGKRLGTMNALLGLR